VGAALIARDAAAHLPACLATLRWADDLLVVVDDRTRDRTAEIAAALGARVAFRTFASFPQLRNEALALARTDWLLFVDADERVTPALAAEIRAAVAGAAEAGFWIPRRNYLCGRWVRGAGWHPDPQPRLLRVGRVHFDPTQLVHEVACFAGPQGHLRQPLDHLNYRSLREFVAKQRTYALLAARTRHQRGEPARRRQLLTMPLREFRRRYLELGGWREGWLGLVLCVLLAWAAFLERRELLRLDRTAGSPHPPTGAGSLRPPGRRGPHGC